jgi:hypothetical protein
MILISVGESDRSFGTNVAIDAGPTSSAGAKIDDLLASPRIGQQGRELRALVLHLHQSFDEGRLGVDRRVSKKTVSAAGASADPPWQRGCWPVTAFRVQRRRIIKLGLRVAGLGRELTDRFQANTSEKQTLASELHSTVTDRSRSFRNSRVAAAGPQKAGGCCPVLMPAQHP